MDALIIHSFKKIAKGDGAAKEHGFTRRLVEVTSDCPLFSKSWTAFILLKSAVAKV